MPVPLDERIAQQGKGPISDPTILLGDFWPEDEPVEAFWLFSHEWRGHNRTDRVAGMPLSSMPT